MPILGPAGRRGRRRGLIVGAAVGSHAAKKNAANEAGAAASSGDQYDELEKLAKLHEQGVLTDEEFAAQKAKLLG